MSVELPTITMGRHKKYDFGEYADIKLEASWVGVSETNMKNILEKLQSETWQQDLIEVRPYFKIAEVLAEKIMNNEPLDDEDIKAFEAVCLISAADNKLLNGAVVVATFSLCSMRAMSKEQAWKRNVGKKPVKEKLYGKAIWALHEEGKSIRKIAEILGMNKETVQKILVRLKNTKTVHEQEDL